ncbi:putative Ubiquitin domain-containing protein [Plasmopara halstedii]
MNPEFCRRSHDLEGLETLYDVALLAKSDIVSQQASNYLIYLHLHVGSKLVRQELNVHVRTQGSSRRTFSLSFETNSLVSELRDRIAKDTGHPADRIRIVNSGKVKLTAQGHGKFTLEKARIFNESVRPSRLHPETLPIKQKSPAISNEAKRISYVEAILLSKWKRYEWHASRSTLDFHGAASAAAAAGIVTDTQAAPTNESMEKAMRTLNNVLAIDGSFRKKPTSFEWKTLLESDCPPKLLYQLELVEKFALCSDRCNGQDSDEEGNQKFRTY